MLAQAQEPPRNKEACVSDGAIWMHINQVASTYPKQQQDFRPTTTPDCQETFFMFPLIVGMQTGVSRCHQSSVRF